MKKSTIFTLIASAILGMSATGCDDYLDVNRNTDAPDYVDAHLYLAGIEQAYQGIYWDIRAIGPLTQMMGTTSYTNFADHYYTKGNDAGGEIWRMVYWNQGKNLENMIKQSIEAESWTLAGIGYAIKAFSWDMMTKMNGEAPMKQAFEPGRTSFDYDYQSEIYPQVRQWAKEAIKYLDMKDDTDYGSRLTTSDCIYAGDKAKWRKFAYAVIARNLASLSNKTDFKAKYYEEFIDAINNAFTGNDDNATVAIAGGSGNAPQSGFNNFFGPYRNNITWSYFPTAWAVEVMTGTVPKYDADGNYLAVEGNTYCPYELAERQIICDTLPETGHFDPRVVLRLGTSDSMMVTKELSINEIKSLKYYGGSFKTTTSPINGHLVPSFWGREHKTNDDVDGIGRWIYRDDAPYIMTTYAELLFDLAEVQYKYGARGEAFETWKKAIAADMEFSAKYITARKVELSKDKNSKVVISLNQGDKITAEQFKALATEYLAGPYVAGLPMSEFSLSHIMMQKFVALYPWGAPEVWVDMRKYMYDIAYTGEYPSKGNGWDLSALNQKTDDDATKVYKGFYLAPAQVQGRKVAYNTDNDGSPCFRLRPRYNSEYMWNEPSLRALLPIAGNALNYHCSIPWFAYPGELPTK